MITSFEELAERRLVYSRSGCDHTGSDMDDGSSYVYRN